jgi:ATP phosphoribosyltransferase regulatory subunit
MTGLPATDALLSLFASEGYSRIEPPILQPADIFLDLSGEDMRRRMFVTQDAAGGELCLRPEYTIPVCREHLAGRSDAGAASYAYAGPVFRFRTGEPGEFLQAGIESIGRSDRAAAEAEVLALALEGLRMIGADPGECRVRLGDMGLLHAIVDALGVPAAAKRRLLRSIVSGRGLDANGVPGVEPEHAGLLAAIEGQDPQAARAFVEDVLSIAGITRVGGRSAGEIAERFLARAAAGRSGILSDEGRAVLQRYLDLTSPPGAAAEAMRALAREASLDLGGALDAFEERTERMAARGLAVDGFSFSAEFARNLDYYTGFIFEVADPGRAGKPVVGGGRYDSLLRHLGATTDVAAVGCAFWLDRIAASQGSARG